MMKRCLAATLILALLFMGCQKKTTEFVKATLASNKGNYEAAAQHLGAIIEEIESPEDTMWVAAHVLRSSAYLNMYGQDGDSTHLDQAIADLDTVLKYRPNQEISYFMRGNLYVRKKEFSRALSDWDTYLNFDTLDAKRWGHRATLFGQYGDYEKALADLDQALYLDADNKFALEYRGVYLTLLNRYEEAEQAYRRFIKFYPEDDSGYDHLAGLFSIKGELDSAIANISKAIQLDSSKWHLYYDRSYFHRKNGELELARQDSIHAESLKP